MEVKPGYKQTEVGVIPDDWAAVPLESMTPRNRKNGIVDGPFGSNLKTIHYRKSGIPIITSGYVTDGKFHAEKYLYVDRAKFLEEKRSAVQPGDIIMAKIGERCGASAILPHTHETGILSGNALKITVDESRYCTSYVWQVLWNMHVSGKLEVLRTVGAQPALSMPNLKLYKIPVPPTKAEQDIIATALGDVDALLRALDRFIAKKRDLKQAAMQQLLTGQTRLPDFHDAWEVKTLKTIVQTPVTDGPHLTPQFLDDGIPFLSVNNLVENRIDLTDLRFISRADHELFSRKCKPRKNDILLGKAASVGKVALVELDIEFNIWSPIAMIRINCDNAPRFVYYQLQSADLITQITLLTNSSSQGNIGMGDIERLTLNLPPLPEQTAIAEVLTDMDAELAALEQRRDKTRDLKQGMMQELLTGRTRLV